MYHLQDSSHLKSFLSTRPDSRIHTFWDTMVLSHRSAFFLVSIIHKLFVNQMPRFHVDLDLISISQLSDYKKNTEQKHKLDKNETYLHLSGSLNFHSRRRLFGETIV